MSYAKGMYQPVQLKISGFANYSGAGDHQVSIPTLLFPLDLYLPRPGFIFRRFPLPGPVAGFLLAPPTSSQIITLTSY